MGQKDDHLPITPNKLPYIEFGGHKRVLANLEPDSLKVSTKFGDSNSTIPRADWIECDWSSFSPTVFDQKSSSACGPHASAMGVMYTINKNRGEVVYLNPFFLYALVNQGQDAGSVLSYNLNALEQYGCCDDKTLPQHQFLVQQQLTQPEFTDASRYKIDKALQCSSFDEIATAIQKGFVVVFGIYVGQNFVQIDSSGICPMPQGRGGGHALLGVGLKKHPRYGWLIKFQNSWGKFGIGGFAYVHEGFFAQQVDAFAIQEATDDPLETEISKPIVEEIPIPIITKVEEPIVELPVAEAPVKEVIVETIITPTEKPIQEPKQSKRKRR